MAARLKVFSTSNGLTESLIAIGSKAKALQAWGATQDLFKQGLARETDDPGCGGAGDRPAGRGRHPFGAGRRLPRGGAGGDS
jgi:hypothetical protein